MNKWHDIWSKKTASEIKTDRDIFEVFKELKIANGFDVQTKEGYYEGLFEDFKRMLSTIHQKCGDFSSVYEVGCGSGVNLFLLNRLAGIDKLGGCDYSESLVNVARSVVDSDDITCLDAESIDVDKKYDIVIADSVFQYFTDAEMGYKVLEKMCQKANKMVVLTEIHDLEYQQEHLNYRRSMIENYDELYEGLDKTFYDKKRLMGVQEWTGIKCTCEMIKPQNEVYWNNKYVFDYYLVKE